MGTALGDIDFGKQVRWPGLLHVPVQMPDSKPWLGAATSSVCCKRCSTLGLHTQARRRHAGILHSDCAWGVHGCVAADTSLGLPQGADASDEDNQDFLRLTARDAVPGRTAAEVVESVEPPAKRTKKEVTYPCRPAQW